MSSDVNWILYINKDIAIARAIVQAGKLLDIEVLDHIVIANWRFLSLKERGLGFA